jgi:hypothetical protein
MIQPVDWSESPEALHMAMPEDRREIYQLVWDCALAVTLVAPVLRHERTIYECNGVKIAVHNVISASPIKGYWRYRRDIPALSFPCNIERGGADTTRWYRTVVSTRGVALGAYIMAITQHGIGTSASLARLLQTLCEGEVLAGAVLLNEADLKLSITKKGQSLLKGWEQSGLTGTAKRTTQLIREVEDGKTDYRTAADQVFQDSPEQAPGAAAYIDAVCTRWKGLGRDEGLNAVAFGEHGMPRHEGLPAWLDPEVLLPATHPLRVLRERMERELVADQSAWYAFTDDERAVARLLWLTDHEGEYRDVLHDMVGEQWRLSALRYWLTGSKK